MNKLHFLGIDQNELSIYSLLCILILGFDLWRLPQESESGVRPILPVEPVGKKLWLFNISADPYEKFDLSDAYPSVVDKMLNRLEDYWKSMVPPKFPGNDPDCDPAKHGGVWGPWK